MRLRLERPVFNKKEMRLQKDNACFNNYRIILFSALLLCVIPVEAQASGMPIFYFMYWVIGFFQLLPLLLLCSKRMKGRSLVASLVYLILLGLMWKYVVLALPQDHALRFSEAEWFSRTIDRKGDYLLDKFGTEDGKTLFAILTVYVPLLLPPLTALGIFLVLRREILPVEDKRNKEQKKQKKGTF